MRCLFALPIVYLGLALAAPPVSAQEVLEGVAGVVASHGLHDIVSHSQVRELVGPKETEARDTLKGQALVEKIKELRLAAIHELIDRILILQDFQARGVDLPESLVDRRIQEIIDREFGGDRAAFLRSIIGQGSTEARYREMQRDNLIVEGTRQQQIAGTASATEAKEKEEAWLEGLRKKAYIKIY